MGSRMVRLVLVLVLVFSLSLLFGCSTGDESNGTDTGTNGDADSPGRALVETKCAMCHTTDRVWATERTTEEWIGVVARMKSHGMVISAEEEALILSALTGD